MKKLKLNLPTQSSVYPLLNKFILKESSIHIEEEILNIAKIKAQAQNLNNVYDQLNNTPSYLSILLNYYCRSFELSLPKSMRVSKNNLGALS